MFYSKTVSIKTIIYVLCEEDLTDILRCYNLEASFYKTSKITLQEKLASRKYRALMRVQDSASLKVPKHLKPILELSLVDRS